MPTSHAKQSGEHSLPKCHFFLPSSTAYFFQNPFHHLHLFSYLWHGALFLVLHTCINKPMADFRRSPSLLPRVLPSDFSFLPLFCSFTEQTHSLWSFWDYLSLLYSTLTESANQTLMLQQLMHEPNKGEMISSFSTWKLIDGIVLNHDTCSTHTHCTLHYFSIFSPCVSLSKYCSFPSVTMCVHV